MGGIVIDCPKAALSLPVSVVLKSCGATIDRHFEKFLSEIDQAKDDDEAWAVICRSVAALGFDTALYLYFPDATAESPGVPITITNYSAEWMDYWYKQGHPEIDIPTRKSLESGYRPLIMDVGKYIDSPDPNENPAALHALWEAKQDGGCGKLYSHQLMHGAVGLGGFALASDSMDSDDFANTIRQHSATLSAMIHIGHARLSGGLVALREQQTIPTLSGRQKDMLVALSKGLRYKEIAHHYGISENTVAFHMAELRRKFKCSTSREILSTAFRFGLLKKL